MFVLSFRCVLCYRFLIFVQVHDMTTAAALLALRSFQAKGSKTIIIQNSSFSPQLARNTIKYLCTHYLDFFFVARLKFCLSAPHYGQKQKELKAAMKSHFASLMKRGNRDSNNDNGVNRVLNIKYFSLVNHSDFSC